ncbi:hypothetical protein AVEN_231074-1 [Araneus ventricosus]|uniref:Secreted protein n=1 Tax=Araneus ventricosus TaxID=182803 RepID=A0A4Y2A348_ARAVE|nr:hypothetical protein AVEN_231074-1 [Araneus ventricosus]
MRTVLLSLICVPCKAIHEDAVRSGVLQKNTYKMDKDLGPDGTVNHGAQQEKAVAGFGHPQPQYLPCMLARAYTLRATSGNVYHPYSRAPEVDH